ncbi:MAG TPA: FIST N-terminal domain-containing protein [Acidimicrobiales bacterium]|nr:FIST N-terminal domain-containing protein [Acidimicrobiales bacterium]
MPFAAALSEHPDPAVAIGEAAGQVLDVLGDGGRADLALLFVTGHHTDALGDATAVVRTLLHPGTTLGVTAVSVVGDAREVEESPAVSLWAGRFGPVHPLRLGPGAGPATEPPFEPSALVLLGDPFSHPVEETFAAVAERWPGLPIVGGLASAARGPGGNRLVLDGEIHAAGAVGAFLGPGLEVETVVSQGCRPIGQPYAVTAVEGNVLRELAGQPAMKRLLDLANDQLTPEEVATVNRGGLHIGRVIDERKVDFERGDFLVRNVVGANQTEGWVAIGDEVTLGDTVQYHLRDADAADDDLRALLTGRTADAALVFTCNGRGVHLFGAPHHDAAVVDEYLGRPAAAGMFCAGEFGPVGGRNFLHGFTASIAILRETGRFGR